MTADKDPNPLVRLAEDAVELAAAGQKAVLDVVAAEMKVLSALASPEPPVGDETPDAAEARQRAEDAEIEAGFDNLPV